MSSTRVRHRTGSRDEMRWSPFIQGLWTARMPAHHVWRTITGADEMKRNEWDECGEMAEWNLKQGKMGETPRKTYPDSVSPNRETHIEWPRRELGTPVQRWEASILTLLSVIIMYFLCTYRGLTRKTCYFLKTFYLVNGFSLSLRFIGCLI